MVNDAILTAEFVQALPVYISKALNVSADDVIVVTITSASGKGSSSKRRRDLVASNESASNSGVIVSMAVPCQSVSELRQLVEDPNSQLYDPSNGQLAELVDGSYFESSGRKSCNHV